MTDPALGEFDLIERYFRRPVSRAIVGPGDDCAVIAPAEGMQLAVSTDMLVEGRHFLPGADPTALGHKALAVNLSDLAAAGAQPMAFTLALALPRVDAAWLQGFSSGLFALADAHGCELVGGDTTGGPLNLCLTVFGEVPAGRALTRGGAQAGDDLWVSGVLGDARLALEAHRLEHDAPSALAGLPPLPGEARARTQAAMDRPQPRVALGLGLRGLATAALDLSDGLAGDVRHLLARSGVGAVIDADAVPRSADVAGLPVEVQRLCTLSGGDDYELLFTAPAARRHEVLELAERIGLPLTRIGRIAPRDTGLRWLDDEGRPLADAWTSFDHFRQR